MGDITLEFLENHYPLEVLKLASVDNRFDEEYDSIKDIRYRFVQIFDVLVSRRNNVGVSEAGRNYNIAITEAENALMRSVKGLYSE